MNMILTAWPIIKWALQALGFLGPEDKAAEREFQLKLLQAHEENRKALTEAFQSFQSLWHPAADRVYVWANTLIALFQPTVLALVYYDVIWGRKQSIQAAKDLEAAGIPGLLVLSIMLFPFYGPALVQGVADAFSAAVGMAVKRRNGTASAGPAKPSLGLPVRPTSPVRDSRTDELTEQPETEGERLARLNQERNEAVTERLRLREERRQPVDVDNPDERPERGSDR